MYGNFDIILDHFSRMSQRSAIPRAPCNVLYLAPRLVDPTRTVQRTILSTHWLLDADWGSQFRCCDQFTSSGKASKSDAAALLKFTDALAEAMHHHGLVVSIDVRQLRHCFGPLRTRCICIPHAPCDVLYLVHSIGTSNKRPFWRERGGSSTSTGSPAALAGSYHPIRF